MKKLSMLVVLLTMAITTLAQEQDVTKFLGIPVDGTKAEMITKLKEKGFTQVDYDDDVVLEGEFNGNEVYLRVVTNNSKVYRIMVSDKKTVSETNIKIRFNNLCKQFENNDRYSYSIDQTISEDEDISYEISVHNKRYEAIFFQTTKEENDKIVNDITDMMIKLIADSTLTDKEREVRQQEITDKLIESSKIGTHKVVWFMISEHYGKYSIIMYYDNELNKANGEDL